MPRAIKRGNKMQLPFNIDFNALTGDEPEIMQGGAPYRTLAMRYAWLIKMGTSDEAILQMIEEDEEAFRKDIKKLLKARPV
jgi:hypothetical protein